MSDARQRLGRQGESLVAQALVQRGYEIADRNWRCQIGEVDIVARHGDAWAFFEVRTRRGRGFGAPEESVTAAKRQRMMEVAQAYLAEHELADVDCRLGVAAVEMDAAGRLVRIELYDSIT